MSAWLLWGRKKRKDSSTAGPANPIIHRGPLATDSEGSPGPDQSLHVDFTLIVAFPRPASKYVVSTATGSIKCHAQFNSTSIFFLTSLVFSIIPFAPTAHSVRDHIYLQSCKGSLEMWDLGMHSPSCLSIFPCRRCS